MNMRMFPIFIQLLRKSSFSLYKCFLISFLLLNSVYAQAATFNSIAKLWSHSSSSEMHACVVRDSGESCWGNNDDGQLADGTTIEYHTPVPTSNNSPLIEIALGQNHTCGLELDGYVRCWGSNVSGQAGTTLNNAIAIGAGAAHSCALISDGTMKCWGSNANGQLGNGSTVDSATAVTVLSVNNVTAIGVGANHTCAVISGGTVKCWGANAGGQLGDTTIIDKSSAVSISGLINVNKLSLGQSHSCALLNDNTVKCWGANADGQLGDASNTQQTSPVSVSSLTNVTAITTAYAHSCALLTDGSAKCWGNNNYGQLGNGSNIASNTPVTVTGLTAVISIAASGYHSCALLINTSAKCWGYNHKGQLSDYTTVDKNTPTTVTEVWANILVESDGYSIYNNESNYYNTGSDFGYVEVNGFLDKTFTISNNGEVDLVLEDSPRVILEEYYADDDCSNFNIQTQPSLSTIPNDGTTTDLVIRYSPVGQVIEYCTVNIVTNDRYETPYRFLIRGFGDKQTQIITFAPLADKTYSNTVFSVSASSDSGLAIEYDTSGNCSNSGATITLTSSGTCIVTASQDGDNNYQPAIDVSQTFSIAKANQTISVFDPIDSALTDSTASLTATTSSGLTASFSSNTPIICSVSGNTVSYLSSGTCTLIASQTGDNAYNAAPDASRNIDVGKANTTMTITQVVYSPSGIGQATTFFFAVNSELGSSMTGTVIVKDNTNTYQCSATLEATQNGISSCEMTFTAKGLYQISASYLGDNNYNPSYSEFVQHQVDKILIDYTTSNTALIEGTEVSDIYTIQLATFPAAPVNITIQPDAQLSVNGLGAGVPLTIQIADTQAIELSVLPVDDTLLEGNHQGIISHNSSSIDPNYNANIRELIFPILDNDAGIVIKQTDLTTQVIEGGDSDRYQIALSLQPDSDVTVEPVIEGSQLTVYPNAATFNRLNWSQAQYFRVSAINDELKEGLHTAQITHTVTTLDETYLNPEWVVDDIIGNTIDVSIIDDDGDVFPTAPSGLTTTISADNQIIFAWLDNSDNESQFTLQQTLAQLPANVTDYAFDTTGMECGISQQFILFASNEIAESEPTVINVILPCPAVSPPSQMSATASNNDSVQLLWIDSNTLEVGYQISRNGQLLSNTPADTQQYNDTGLLCGAVYDYAVRAIDSNLQLSTPINAQVILACSTGQTDSNANVDNEQNSDT
ncbi:MAG: Ig-like domain repeat protein, partial [Thiotrichaceae bacterium]|nr:Ig-like domain repeat protein [Thiotrichaceae bacterium]